MGEGGDAIQRLALAVAKNACGSSQPRVFDAVFHFGAEFSSGSKAVTKFLKDIAKEYRIGQ